MAKTLNYQGGGNAGSEVVDLREQYRDYGVMNCPMCGKVYPTKVKRWSMAVAFGLLFFGILPGLIYALFYRNIIYACPSCGMKLGEVA